MLGREDNPSGVAAAPDTPVHPSMKIVDARLSDDAGPAEISLHLDWQMREVRVRDRFRRGEALERAIDVAVVRRPQARRALSQKAEADANQHDKVRDCAKLRVGPEKDDDEHRDDNRARPNRPPASAAK